MNFQLLKRHLLFLEILSWIQRCVRVSLRAAWLGMGAFLVAWSSNSLLGWLPDPKIWSMIGIAIFLLSLLGVLFPWLRSKRFVWKLDRQLGGKEQVSTAWEVVNNGLSGRVEDALIKDVLVLLPAYRKKIILKGWYLFPDLVSVLIVFCIFFLIITTQPVSYEINRDEGNLPLQPSIEEPTLRDVFPAGSPGLQKLADLSKGVETTRESSYSSGTDVATLTPEGYQKVTEAFRELGNELSKNAATYEVGEALMRMELEQAASAMDSLAAGAAQLSPETRDDFAQSLQDAAMKLPDMGSLDLYPHLMEAAHALIQEDLASEISSVQNSIEDIVGDLREVSTLMDSQLKQSSGESEEKGGESGEKAGAGKGAGLSTGSERGSPEPFLRLMGEGETIELESISESMQSALRQTSKETHNGTASGARSSVASGSSTVIEAELVPFRYPWKWRDVVSKYFSP